MTKKIAVPRIETGIRNLDAILGGGLPEGSVTVFAGTPGAGKTILAQQVCFHNASRKRPALYFGTLSEPTAKIIRYLQQFTFYDSKKMDDAIRFIDLGIILQSKGLEEAHALLMEHVKKINPAIVVVDSFKVFDDLAKSPVELRKFGYEIAVNLMAWETTALLLGEYGQEEIDTKPIFSIIDGLVRLTQRESSGEQQRYFQAVKMRGTAHSRDEHAFVINANGLELYAPRVTIQREPGKDPRKSGVDRCKTGIARLDELLGPGIPRGSSLLIAGVAGTGKTVLLLEFIYRGAQAGEKGVVFSFEETDERLRATARGLGWDLDREMKRGMVEIVFIPQPNVLVEGHLLMMQERVQAIGAKRIAIDSVSVFLHKIKDPQIAREKVFQLASIVQNAQAVSFLATDIPYGSNQVSRFGVEETVVDGVLLLSSREEGLERERYVEIYKLRNTAHLKGRHNMTIGKGGMTVFPRYLAEAASDESPPSISTRERISSGVPGLDELIGGGLLRRSMTLISGSAGIGKTTLGLQFLLEGANRKEPGIYVTLEEGPAQVLGSADVLGLPLRKAVKQGRVEIIYISRELVRVGQFLSLLADKIKEKKARRLVFDSASHIATYTSWPDDELRHLLYNLVMRFKTLDVTSIFTLESRSMFLIDSVTDRDFSPVADNLLMLRYIKADDKLCPSLTVVKTRGSGHDRGLHVYEIGKGGMRISQRTGDPSTSQRSKKRSSANRRQRARKSRKT